MKNRPVPVLIVAAIFIIAGCTGIIYHAGDFFDPHYQLPELIWVMLLRIAAIVCGVLLILGINWARWLAIAWLLYHIVISTFHSASEVITHTIFLIIVTVLLYLPVSNIYFKAKK
ncbi:MAG: hypothetical protein EKK37_06100 [Sphingobacteriales bacterium]|nr:MAG: hypothetical protein EKK37_06100 [Sphingobacteriales bacterium]